jgi:hypothetical protein
LIFFFFLLHIALADHHTLGICSQATEFRIYLTLQQHHKNINMSTAVMNNKVPPRLARALYRSMLRCSFMGNQPGVFGAVGALAFARQAALEDEHLSVSLPQNSEQVRRRLKDWFQKPLTDETTLNENGHRDDHDLLALSNLDKPLETLRLVRKQASLLSISDDVPLPIFEYDGVAALANETVNFCFVEPRYLELAARVWQSPSRQFLLKAKPGDDTATLLYLQSHMTLPNGMIAVSCLSGHRVLVHQVATEHVEGDVHPEHAAMFDLHKAPKTLHSAIKYSWCPDQDYIDPITFSQTRRYVLYLLHTILPYQGSTLLHTLGAFGLPPLDPEGFSFWALRHLLANDDADGRIEWTHNCMSTHQRLNFVVDELESILQYQARRAA